MNMDVGSVVEVSKAISTPAPGPVSAGGQLAALKARLKMLFKAVKNAGMDSSLDARSKKMLMQSLQAEIQMVMQRIAALESGNKKIARPIDAVMQAAAEDKADKGRKNKDKDGDGDASPYSPADLLQGLLSFKKIDITV